MKGFSKYKRRIRALWTLMVFGVAGLFILNSCETELGQIYKDTTKELVYSYLKIEENREEFSILVEAMDKSGLAGMLNSYGEYTLFAPSNPGFESWFASNDLTGLDELDTAEVRDLLVYHIFNKERTTADLLPGFSTDTTAAGDYMAFDRSRGEGEIFINGKSKMYKINSRVSNGIVHHIDQVLNPPSFNLWNYIGGRSTYSIFAAGIQKADLTELLYDVDLKKGKLNSTVTVFAETNEVFNKAGINSLAELEDELDDRDSDLQEFMEYHIITGKKLDGAIFSFMIQNEGLVTRSGLSINANIDFGLIFNQWWDKEGNNHGVRLLENKSDIFAKNGVIHGPDQVMFVPEDLEQEPIIRECEYGVYKNENTDLWEADEDSLAEWTPGTRVYLESNEKLLRYDAQQKNNYVSFKFENVIPGNYNVVLGYVPNSAYAKVQLYVDGSPVGETVDLTEEETNDEVVIGEREFLLFGSHDFKFVHLTNGDGMYDYIKLDPVLE